ncbi:class I SAM-dependent methyltransferase [Candidatus Parcubacteria bacterium]|nr:MAG: class I SAM-dependent methyltransferase [Candidatus Parcubacteria bacterium]
MQRDAWQREYERGVLIPTVKRTRPSSAVETFERYIAENGFRVPGPLLDMGCGNGRHLFHFAEKGHVIWGFDFIPGILASLKIAARSDQRIHVFEHALPHRLPFKDRAFGAALDITTTISLSDAELNKTKREIIRVLKPGGWLIGYHVSDRNAYLKQKPYYRDAQSFRRGKRFVSMQNGLVERIWNIPELVSFWQPLQPYFLAIREKKDRFGSKTASIEMITAIFRKS